MNPILAHPSAKSITLTLSSKCLDPVMMRIATLLLTGQHWCEAPVAAREHPHYVVELSPSLPLSCHAAAGPRRTQPRSIAQRTATVCEAPVAAREHRHYVVELSPSPPLSCHAAAGPRRTQPRSTAQRTATVCEAPVAAREHRHYVVELSPSPP